MVYIIVLVFLLVLMPSLEAKEEIETGETPSVFGNNERAFLNEGVHEVVSFQFLFPMQCTLQTCYLSTDTTTRMTWAYIPLTVTLGADVPILKGYFHAVPKFCYESNVLKGDYPFWGVGGAIAFELHPLPATERNPYLYVSSGVIDMTQMDYEGMGYSIDIGFGMFLAMRKSVLISPFLAYPLVSHWEQKRETDYCDGCGNSLYNGRKCDHVGVRVGFSVHYKSVWEKRW